jgi:hypothetical protein
MLVVQAKAAAIDSTAILEALEAREHGIFGVAPVQICKEYISADS